jgi:hypothetical protein
MNSILSNLSLFALVLGKCGWLTGIFPGMILAAIFARGPFQARKLRRSA